MATWQPPQTASRPLRVGDVRVARIAAALAALLLVGGLVVRGSLGLRSETPERYVRTDPVTGLIVDGSAGLTTSAAEPLFDGVVLHPGQTVEACVRIDYRGSADPDAVALELADVTGSSDLARGLTMVVDRGSLGDATGCSSFVAAATVGAGPLDALAGREGATALGAWDPDAGEHAAWYRFRVTLDPGVEDQLQGETVATGFTWSALAAPESSSWMGRLTLLVGTVARNSIIPMLLLLAVTVLFLGIQDRIDRRDPKLALAPVTQEPLPFTPRSASAPVSSTVVDGTPVLAPLGGTP